ncbi:MAG: outer membrane protein assembly factor, partial [candidate division KSB1 bacterium]|nr:outer membrane protein assembly factor [candidate division KSB1 bacterium]
ELIVTVVERVYFFPYPIFFINEKDWKKISIGAGVLHSNFRGRREILTVYGWGGYNPAINVEYSNPWLLGSANLLTRVNFFANRLRNRSFDIQNQDVNEKRIGGSWSIGRRFGLFTYFSVDFGYMELKFDPPVPGQTLAPSGLDKLPSLGFNFIYEARDLFEFPLSGIYTRLWAKRTGFRSEYVHYFRYGADLRAYKKISSHLSLAGRVMADLHDDVLPIYDHVFLGYSNRVRGHFYSKKEGENLAMASLELRWPILPVRYFNLEEAPMFGSYMQHLHFGMSLSFFTDYGRVWSPDKENDLSLSEQLGFGAGLNLHVPFVYLVRLEWAFNQDGKGEGIIDLRVSF